MVKFSATPADDLDVWWLWVFGGLVGWLVLSLPVALLLGRRLRLADQAFVRRSSTDLLPGVELPAAAAATPPAAAAAPPAAAGRARRRAVPLPPIGIALVAVALVLMTSGYLIRLSGSTDVASRLLSMDAPFALPRMFVAALFTAGALIAVSAAARMPARRAWWLGVSLVAAGIAGVKAGGTVHSAALGALGRAVGDRAAVLISAVAAAAVVAALWFLSRTDRRDRRRILGTLGCYAVASVGLSTISTVVPAGWAVTATFVEESGEALAGVAFLVAVLVGAVPHLVLPADWALRRTADRRTAEVPHLLPRRLTARDIVR